MNKLLPALLLCLPLAAVAEPERANHHQREMCQNLIQDGAFNFYLEENCSFNGGVSRKFTQIIERQCADIFTDGEALALSEEAIQDGMMRFERYGKTEFCSANRSGYTNAGKLMDELIKRGR